MTRRFPASAHSFFTVHLRFLLIVGAVWASGIFGAHAQSPAVSGQTYAIMICGIPGQEPYGRWYNDWSARLKTYLTGTAHVPADHVTILSGKNATLDAITTAFGQLAKTVKPEDQLIVFIAGHGQTNGDVSLLTLEGSDPTPDQLAKLINSVPAKNQVVLNFSACSGDFLKTLSAPGRVNIAATSPTELEEPVYAEFFLRGLESKRADADKNGTITLLEAFNWAAQQTVHWIVRWQQTSDKQETSFTTWKASGKETVEVFDKLYSGVPTRKLDPASDRNAADTDTPLEPPGGQITADWNGRRAVDEHAMLEDCGQGTGVAVFSDKGLVPIAGAKPGDPGYLAAHTVLGQPALLNP